MRIRNFLLMITLPVGLLSCGVEAKDKYIDIFMRGTLTGKEGEPCIVKSDSAEQQVKFDPVPTYAFYKQPRSKVKKFSIILEKCDLSRAKPVSPTSSGLPATHQHPTARLSSRIAYADQYPAIASHFRLESGYLLAQR